MSIVKAIGSISTLMNKKDKGIMTTQLKVRDTLDIYTIDKRVNRDLGYHRLPKLAKYFDSIDSNIGIFLPSIVLSFRGNPSECYDKENSALLISDSNKLVVIDGQHRIKGLETFVGKRNIDENKRDKILNSYLTVQIYFGLSLEDEKKLFTDINTNAKRVSRSLITKYDTRDILNILVKELYHSCSALQIVKVEFIKSRIVRPNNTTFITSVRLKKFINLVLFGKESSSQKDEKQIKEQYDEIFSFFNKLFELLFSTLPAAPGDVLKYVLGHEPMQNAIALYLHESIIIDNEKDIQWLEIWEDEIEQLGVINWSVKNRDWYPYMMTGRKNTQYEYQSLIETTTYDLNEVICRKIM